MTSPIQATAAEVSASGFAAHPLLGQFVDGPLGQVSEVLVRSRIAKTSVTQK